MTPSGEFDRAFQSTFATNSTDSGASSSAARNANLRIFLAVPSFPETFIVNVTIYSFGMSALLIFSVTVWQCINVLPKKENGRKEWLRDRIPRAIGVILCAMVLAVCAAHFHFAIQDVDQFLVDAILLFGAVIAASVVIGLIVMGKTVASSHLHEDKLLEYQTISIQALFQVYDLVKDGFFLGLGIEAVDLAAFGLTVVDVVLSVLMLAELYTESESQFPLSHYAGMVLQFVVYSMVFLLVPPYWLLLILIVPSVIVYCLPDGWDSYRLILLSCLIGLGSQQADKS